MRFWISVSCSSYNLVYLEGFPFWNFKVIQSIKLHIIYFSLTDINIRTVIVLISIHLPSIVASGSFPENQLSCSFEFQFLLKPLITFWEEILRQLNTHT